MLWIVVVRKVVISNFVWVIRREKLVEWKFINMIEGDGIVCDKNGIIIERERGIIRMFRKIIEGKGVIVGKFLKIVKRVVSS